MFLFAPILGGAWYLGLAWAASLFHHEAEGTRFLIRPSLLYWAIPAILLGLISSVIPLDLFYRAFLRERYCRLRALLQ